MLELRSTQDTHQARIGQCSFVPLIASLSMRRERGVCNQMQTATFPVCPAWLVHVYMCVNEARCHKQISIVENVLQAEGKGGRMGQICLRRLSVDCLDVNDPAVSHMDCMAASSTSGDGSINHVSCKLRCPELSSALWPLDAAERDSSLPALEMQCDIYMRRSAVNI